MKTLKTLLATTVIFFSLNSFTVPKQDAQKLTLDYALKIYIDAITAGKVKGFADILDGDVKFTATRGEKIINYTRGEMLASLKQSENITQNCQTEHTFVEQSPTQVIVKVSMKYEGFSRINYVTMAQTNKGWKITSVSSVFL